MAGGKQKKVAFKLRLQERTWMAIGIHRPGGSGMPRADMVVVDSQDEGANFLVHEAWTLNYGAPLGKSTYDSDATSGLAGNCAVVVMDGEGTPLHIRSLT